MAKTPNRMKDADEFSTFTNDQFIKKKADGTGFESAPAGGGSVDTSGTPVANDYARFTDSNTIEGRDYSEVRTDLGLVIGTNVQAYSAVLQNTTASFTTAQESKLTGIEAGADVTDTANVTAAGALMDSEVTSLTGIKTLTLPDDTAISTFAKTILDDDSAASMRITLGAGDASGPAGGVVTDELAVYGNTTGKLLTGSGITLAGIQPAIDHVSDTANPHNTKFSNLVAEDFASLQLAITDELLATLTVANEYADAGVTYDSTPATTDKILLEDGTTGAKKYTTVDDLPAGAEANDLETLCTGILVDEVPVGSATDDVTYKPLVSGVLKYATGGAFSAATIGDLMTAGSGISFTSSTLNVGAGTGVTVGTDDISVNYGTTSTTACVGNDARLKAPPKAVTVETPVSGNVILMGRSDRTLTIANVHGVIDSGNSVIVSLDSGASRATSDQQHVNAQTVNSTTTGNDLTKTANLTFDAGDWIWLTIGTVSGTVGSICITVSFT